MPFSAHGLDVFGRVIELKYVRDRGKGKNGKLYYHPFDGDVVAYYDPARRIAILHPVEAGRTI